MSSSPDFVAQVQDVERSLNAEWNGVQEGWQDSVAEGFNEGVMGPFLRNFRQYVTGEGLSGYGLDQLLQQMENHQQQMEMLTN